MIHRSLTPATVEPVTLAEAKVVCAVDAIHREEDAHIEHLIRSARHYAQGDPALYGNRCAWRRRFSAQRLGLLAAQDSWFQLRIMPANRGDDGGLHAGRRGATEMDLADFYLEAEQGLFHITGAWPGRARPTGVAVTFTAGYAPAAVPPGSQGSHAVAGGALVREPRGGGGRHRVPCRGRARAQAL